MRVSSPRLIFLLCLSLVLGMAGFAAFPALLPVFLDLWGWSSTDAGWVSGVTFVGYLVAVPVLLSLTDRIDARIIFVWSSLATAVAMLGFAIATAGFWTAMVWRVLGGIGLAGTYMPGLKILTDRLSVQAQPRAVGFYTATYGIGAAASYYLAGVVANWLDWRWAFGMGALGSVLSLLLVQVVVPYHKPDRPAGHLLDFRPILSNRRVMAYVLAYAAHNWELFGVTSWMVVFLVYVQGLHGAADAGLSATAAAALVTLMALPASLIGNEASLRWGRRRMAILFMLGSGLFGIGFGFSGPLAYGVVVLLALVYGATVSWDSATITAGAVGAADPDLRGAAMAVHSCIGFIGAALGPLAFGVVLDLGGGRDSGLGWILAFAAMSAGVVLGPVAIALLDRDGYER